MKFKEIYKGETGMSFVKEKMKKSLVVITALLFLTAGCGKKETAETGSKKVSDLDTIAVQTAAAEVKQISLLKTYSGSLEGEEQANIVAKLPERIVAVRVKVGQHVKAGEILVSLDKAGASSQYFQAEAAYKNAEKDLHRMEALFNEGAISRQMLDGTQTGFSIAKANFEAAKSSVELTSPISGVVTAVNVNTGDLAQIGIPLATVANLSSMKITFSVNELDLPNFAAGQSVKIFSEMNASLVRTGKILQSSKSAEIDSRTFEVKAAFPNTSDGWFKPGMFCKAERELVTGKNNPIIPTKALTNSSNGIGVFTVKNDRAYFNLVTVGLSNDNESEILSGLSSGDKVVTVGMSNLKNGVLVRYEK